MPPGPTGSFSCAHSLDEVSGGRPEGHPFFRTELTGTPGRFRPLPLQKPNCSPHPGPPAALRTLRGGANRRTDTHVLPRGDCLSADDSSRTHVLAQAWRNVKGEAATLPQARGQREESRAAGETRGRGLFGKRGPSRASWASGGGRLRQVRGVAAVVDPGLVASRARPPAKGAGRVSCSNIGHFRGP